MSLVLLVKLATFAQINCLFHTLQYIIILCLYSLSEDSYIFAHVNCFFHILQLKQLIIYSENRYTCPISIQSIQYFILTSVYTKVIFDNKYILAPTIAYFTHITTEMHLTHSLKMAVQTCPKIIEINVACSLNETSYTYQRVSIYIYIYVCVCACV